MGASSVMGVRPELALSTVHVACISSWVWTTMGVVTEIPFVDEDTKRELFSLLGDWYKPESTESLFSSMPSDAVFFSS